MSQGRLLAITFLAFLLLLSNTYTAHALTAVTDKDTYTSGECVEVSITTQDPGATVVLLVYGPDNKSLITLDQATTDDNGQYTATLFCFPQQPHERYPEGVYTIYVGDTTADESLNVTITFQPVLNETETVIQTNTTTETPSTITVTVTVTETLTQTVETTVTDTVTTTATVTQTETTTQTVTDTQVLTQTVTETQTLTQTQTVTSTTTQTETQTTVSTVTQTQTVTNTATVTQTVTSMGAAIGAAGIALVIGFVIAFLLGRSKAS